MDVAALSFAHLAPYNTTSTDHLEFYDHIPYKRNSDRCGADQIAMESGNLIKFYQCAKKEPCAIANHDEEFRRKLEQLRKTEERQRTRQLELQQQKENKENASSLTEEETNALFSDSSNEEP
ncbi:MAG: hypothetical protein PUB10_08880 [Clostridiales bacterium]|nr:hypothetical protein [Clostridiales bacterium]